MMLIEVESRKGVNGVVELTSYDLRGKKWYELFNDENELLELTKSIDTVDFKKKGFSGYLYIRSFSKSLNSGRELNSKQLIELKKIASEVYAYYWNKEHAV
ncbi:hypothetical protein ACIQ1D_18775 [Lysinibacillus xylanilyticus]|uniref:hypothetical protein n=1 Tax=Lysinibacillus xylanilyticus TaxID=582475 RepID=UPI0038151680